MFYSGWLAGGSCLIFPHLPERIIRNFGYTQTILKHSAIFAPPTMMRREMNAMFDDYLSHLVPKEAHNTITKSDWSYVDGYIRWFFRVSHPYMVQAALGDSLRPAHQKILEEEQAQLGHAHDVFPRCRRILEIAQTTIDIDIFSDGSELRRERH
ncbi:uncharacterized protein LOC127137907 [Lathyrus oleraceus]|uniref:uncharacterized protein LOC127137907 n=1 Tax=Pisum sativum TaxID=3888 RepID=UPI0021D21F01|nr:uncharacterized protein LOC127137907 [Pisum sativum]